MSNLHSKILPWHHSRLGPGFASQPLSHSWRSSPPHQQDLARAGRKNLEQGPSQWSKAGWHTHQLLTLFLLQTRVSKRLKHPICFKYTNFVPFIQLWRWNSCFNLQKRPRVGNLTGYQTCNWGFTVENIQLATGQSTNSRSVTAVKKMGYRDTISVVYPSDKATHCLPITIPN